MYNPHLLFSPKTCIFVEGIFNIPYSITHHLAMVQSPIFGCRDPFMDPFPLFVARSAWGSEPWGCQTVVLERPDLDKVRWYPSFCPVMIGLYRPCIIMSERTSLTSLVFISSTCYCTRQSVRVNWYAWVKVSMYDLKLTWDGSWASHSCEKGSMDPETTPFESLDLTQNVLYSSFSWSSSAFERNSW